MDFCSKYGYNYGHEGSDEEDCEIDDTSRHIRTKMRKADTNIVSIKFDKLTSPNEMFAGEPKKCACGAFMSHISAQNVQKVDEKFMWKCEFCEQTNDMSGVLEDVNEIPKDGDVTFLLEAAKGKAQSAAASASSNAQSTDNAYLTFCMDNSGSMSTRIPAKKDANNDNNHIYNNITRLEGIKIACLETLNKLKENEPEKQVSLVTFSNYVKYYGDCTKVRNNEPLVKIDSNNDLNNKESIQSKASNTDGEIKGIGQTHKNIESHIKSLRTEGSTALGPALLYSIGFASKKPGSSIILCTDGCANVGLGSIESGNNIAEGEKYYDEIADFAKDQGVVVNVLSMEGTDCKLNVLGRVADRSNGVLNIVNPLNLSEEFKSILENRLVATNVQAKLIVNHKYLYIREEKLEEEEAKARENNDEQARKEAEKKRQSVVVRDIGNANIDTEITFEYGIRKIENTDQRPEDFNELPFQLQISYTAVDGSKAVRVYTKIQKFTRNRNEAERNLTSRDLLFMHKAQATTSHMLKRNIVASKMKNSAYDNMYQRNYWDKARYEDDHYNKIHSAKLAFCMDECNDTDSKEYYYENKLSRLKLEKQRMMEEDRLREREKLREREILRERERLREQERQFRNLIVDDSDSSDEEEKKKKEDEKKKKEDEKKKKEDEKKKKEEEEELLKKFAAALRPAADVDKKDDEKKNDEKKNDEEKNEEKKKDEEKNDEKKNDENK